MLRVVRLTLLCNVIFVVVTISASQESRPVRPVVAEAIRLGILLEGQCSSVGSFPTTSETPIGPGSGSEILTSGSGLGDFCSNAYQVNGPLCADVLQAQLCEYNFTSQTCDLCNNLLSTCGPPGGQEEFNILVCLSQSAQACGPLTRSCFEDQTVPPETCDFCTFVGNTCFQLDEAALCAVDGLLDGCTNLLDTPYQCECFSPSSTCQLCRTVLPVCSTPATIPVSLNNLVTSELFRYDTQHQILILIS